MERSCLSKKERICTGAQIRKLFKNGYSYRCNGAKLFVLSNQLPYNRFICTFKRHYGTAVQRNKARRLSKEVYRRMKCSLVTGKDILLFLLPGNDTFLERKQQLQYLFKKAELFNS